MSLAATTILLGLASFAAAQTQTSSIRDPLTGEPIQLIKGSDIRQTRDAGMRRKMQSTCDEAIDPDREIKWHPSQSSPRGVLEW